MDMQFSYSHLLLPGGITGQIIRPDLHLHQPSTGILPVEITMTRGITLYIALYIGPNKLGFTPTFSLHHHCSEMVMVT